MQRNDEEKKSILFMSSMMIILCLILANIEKIKLMLLSMKLIRIKLKNS